MTTSDPPRVAAALLRRFLADDEPLAGDLLEGFAARQSRLWFWRQVLLALVIRWSRQRAARSPLGLAEHASFAPAERWQNAEPRRINLTASPLPDVGGLGLVAFGVIVAMAGPGVLLIFLPAVVGGVACGLSMALIRRRALLSTSATATRTFLRDSDS
jgi:hypothetical protein